jgi:hypothetical protein
MTKRPISITVFCWFCIVFGVGGFFVNLELYWLVPLPTPLGSNPFGMIIHMLDPAWRISLYPNHWYSDMHPLAMWLFPAQWGFLAVCGVFMLFGFKWSRWMLATWVGYHSFQTIAHTRFELMFEVFTYIHSPWESLVYLQLFISNQYIVFSPAAGKYFRVAQAAA